MSTSALDPRDAILQAHVPAVMVPRFTNFPPLQGNGHRYLIAGDGLWIEVVRPWLNLCWMVAPSPAPLPYGDAAVNECIDFGFELDGMNFEHIMDMFTLDARKAVPNECAAWGVWDEKLRRLDYRPLVAIESGPARIQFHRPKLADHEHLAVDLHSHGHLSAGFSSTDDADDAGEVKLAVVIGGCDSAHEHYVMRLCAHGLYIPFEDDPEGADR